MESIIILVFVNGILGIELLNNPGFENPDLSDNWGGWGFKLESITDDVHGGTRAVKVSGRTEGYQGPEQYVVLQPGERYDFSSSVKQLNDHTGKMFQSMNVTIEYSWVDDGTLDYFCIAEYPFAQAANGWVPLGGDFTAPVRNFSKARLFFQGPDPGIDFIVDDSSLQPVDEDINWKAEADARIKKFRKNNIYVRVIDDSLFDPADIEIKIDHKRHSFGFGTLVRPDWITISDFQEYQNLVYGMFNWATVSAFYWNNVKGINDHPDYKFAVDVVKELKTHGMKVRGYEMFLGVPGRTPAWVEALDADMLEKVIADRVTYLTNITHGLLDHWDVSNGLIHGQLFEEKTGDPHYSEKIYNMIHKADPVPHLFLTNYDVLADGALTEAYVDQAKEYKKANVELYGLGLKSYFGKHFSPDPTLLKKRLDKLSDAGLPLWVTEMSIKHHDENTKAEWLDRALRMYFSHPAVEGIILWGFWDYDTDTDRALINGHHFYVNAAGQRYLDLIKKEWSTHESHKLSDGSSFTVNGFQGDYDLVVYNKGTPITRLDFQLGKANTILQIHIRGNGSEITLPSTVDPFVHITHPVHITHDGEHLIGRAFSWADNSDIQCETRWSGFSKPGDDQTASIQCQADELLTGCSSIHQNNGWRRDGERIEIHGGNMVCVAVNGDRSKEGIQAVARCCKTEDLKCVYRGSGPSDDHLDAMVETTCQHDEIAMGCSANSWTSEMSGSYPSSNQKGCIAQNYGIVTGSWSYAACCSAPRLTCKTMTSLPSQPHKGNSTSVTCDKGYVMTSCNVRSATGKTAGAYIGRNLHRIHLEWCVAVNGEDKYGGDEGVVAVAVCCQV